MYDHITRKPHLRTDYRRELVPMTWSDEAPQQWRHLLSMSCCMTFCCYACGTEASPFVKVTVIEASETELCSTCSWLCERLWQRSRHLRVPTEYRLEWATASSSEWYIQSKEMLYNYDAQGQSNCWNKRDYTLVSVWKCGSRSLLSLLCSDASHEHRLKYERYESRIGTSGKMTYHKSRWVKLRQDSPAFLCAAIGHGVMSCLVLLRLTCTAMLNVPLWPQWT
jgi:hypothetical protein